MILRDYSLLVSLFLLCPRRRTLYSGPCQVRAAPFVSRYSFQDGGIGTTTPDKTVETFPYNFQFRTMVPSCPKETNSPPSPPLVQCCFGLAAQTCISCVAANNIAKGEGGHGLLICDSKHFWVLCSAYRP